MNDIIKNDLKEIIKSAIDAIKKGEVYSLNELSNHTIHNASIFQDEYSVSIAVIIYSISKILEAGSKDTRQITYLLERGLDELNQDKFESYELTTKEILKMISTIDTRISHFIEEVVKQAEIKKGTKIYDHGISLGRVASLLGLSQWELMEYVGKTKVDEQNYERPDVIEKIKFTKEMFQ